MRLRRNTLKAALAVTLVAALSVSLVGCGGKTEAEGDGGTTTEVKVLKIGVGAPLTAGAVEFGQDVQRGTELAVMQANEREDVKELGIKFEVKSGDDMGDPKTGVNVANQFISDKALVGVMGHLNSGVSLPASKIYADKNIPMISASSTDPALTAQGYENIFRTIGRDDFQGPPAAEFAVDELGAKVAFVIDDSTSYGAGLAAEFAKKFQSLGGTVAGSEKVSDKETEFSSVVTKAKAANADVIYYGGMYTTAALFAKQARSAGVATPILGGDGVYNDAFIELAGADGSVDVYSVAVGAAVEDLPQGAQFMKDYEAAFPGNKVGTFGAFAFDAANAIIEGVIKVAQEQGVDKVTTSEGLAAVCAAIHSNSFDGVTGTVSFDENGDTLNTVITRFAIKDGAWTVLK